MLPKSDEKRRFIKRSLAQDVMQPNIKRAKFDIEVDKDLIEKQNQAIEINEKFIAENLNKNVCVQLVMNNLMKVPENMPSWFLSEYKESLKLGLAGDVKIIAKLLAEQFVETGTGPGNKIIGKTALVKDTAKNDKNNARIQENEVEEKEKVITTSYFSCSQNRKHALPWGEI